MYKTLRLETLEGRNLLATLHVDINDVDCNVTGPVFCQIQQAVDAAVAGDNITVAAGTYRPVKIGKSNITIQEATPDADPTIEDSSDSPVWGIELKGSNVVIKGLHAVGTAGFFAEGNDNQWIDNVLDGGGYSGNSGIINHGERNEYRDNVAVNLWTGFWVPGCDYKVTGNTSHNNMHGFFVTGCNGELFNNIASHNYYNGFEIAGSDNVFTGNHSYDNGENGFIVGEELFGASVVGNVFHGNTSTGNGKYGFETGNTFDQFVFEGNECRANNLGGDNQDGSACLVLTEDHVFGDSNGDRSFSTEDLILALAAGLYETGRSATYPQGDWNDDGVFDSSDLIDAIASGRFVVV